MVPPRHHLADIFATFRFQEIAKHDRRLLQMKRVLRADHQMHLAQSTSALASAQLPSTIFRMSYFSHACCTNGSCSPVSRLNIFIGRPPGPFGLHTHSNDRDLPAVLALHFFRLRRTARSSRSLFRSCGPDSAARPSLSAIRILRRPGRHVDSGEAVQVDRVGRSGPRASENIRIIHLQPHRAPSARGMARQEIAPTSSKSAGNCFSR